MNTKKLLKEGFSEYEAEVIENYNEFGKNKIQIINYQLGKTIRRIIFFTLVIIGLLIYKKGL